MKNLFFTAVAVVAFSGVSLAGTKLKSIKKTKKIEKKELVKIVEKKNVVFPQLTCNEIWGFYFAIWVAHDGNRGHAASVAYGVWSDCLAGQGEKPL